MFLNLFQTIQHTYYPKPGQEAATTLLACTSNPWLSTPFNAHLQWRVLRVLRVFPQTIKGPRLNENANKLSSNSDLLRRPIGTHCRKAGQRTLLLFLLALKLKGHARYYLASSLGIWKMQRSASDRAYWVPNLPIYLADNLVVQLVIISWSIDLATVIHCTRLTNKLSTWGRFDPLVMY